MQRIARDWLIFLLIIAVISAVGVAAVAGQTGAATTPANPSVGAEQESIDPTSGKQLYGAYCSLCHGSDGKGGGPFSPQLKVPPPDLTQLLKNNRGVYPEMRVREAIDGEFGKPSHGSSEMPIWGPIFRQMAHGKRDSAQVRINSLVKYVESMQQR